MVCKDPDNEIPNVGIYRHEVKSKDELSAMLCPAHHAAYIARRCAELDRPMEVAIYIGHHPALTFAAASTISFYENEFELMGGILNEPMAVTRCETVDLSIPAYAEIIIEGIIDIRQTTTDGPFAEWEGYYGGEIQSYPLKVSCITMRKDAIYHDLANSQREHNLAGTLSKTSGVYKAVRDVVPSIKDVYMPISGRTSIIVYVSISKRVPGEGKRAALAAVNWQENTRIAVVVDDDINIYDEEEVLWAIATRSRADTDVSIIPGVLGDTLCPTSYDESGTNKGPLISKMIIDATKPIDLKFPSKVTPSQEIWDSLDLNDYVDLH
jgi:2,5-furandicarboxylate decarboxylase 1